MFQWWWGGGCTSRWGDWEGRVGKGDDPCWLPSLSWPLGAGNRLLMNSLFLSLSKAGLSAQWLHLASLNTLDHMDPWCYWLPWDPSTSVDSSHESSLPANPSAITCPPGVKEPLLSSAEKPHFFPSAGLKHISSFPSSSDSKSAESSSLPPYPKIDNISHLSYYCPQCLTYHTIQKTHIKHQEQWCEILLKTLWEDRGRYSIAHHTEEIPRSPLEISLPQSPVGSSHSSPASSIRHCAGTSLNSTLFPHDCVSFFVSLLISFTWVTFWLFHLHPHSHWTKVCSFQMWRERNGAIIDSSPQPPLWLCWNCNRDLCGVLWTHIMENVAVFGGVLKGFPEEVTFILDVEGWRGVFQIKQDLRGSMVNAEDKTKKCMNSTS